MLTSGGSKVLADFVPDEDSTIVRRLDDAGAVLLGKLNLSEFAIGGTIDHPFGTPRNPWNTEHTAGGSSSGSGIAAAGGLCARARWVGYRRQRARTGGLLRHRWAAPDLRQGYATGRARHVLVDGYGWDR